MTKTRPRSKLAAFASVAVLAFLLFLIGCGGGMPADMAGPDHTPDFVELVKADPSIMLDIKYATADNFTGMAVYPEARAFLLRPAAEALLKASASLKKRGYGLLVYDAYRPWSVTKIFWDVTPQDKKCFVAPPHLGSSHNRGRAVDVSLYNLKTGAPVEMPSGYDEMTHRAFPDYDGGSANARKLRDLLRSAMESNGFVVHDCEWWHFDYMPLEKAPVMDIPFDRIKAGQPR